MFQDVLLFELFIKTYPILFYFHLKSAQKSVPAKTYWSGKKLNGNCLKGRQTPSKLVTAVLNLSNPDIQHHFGSISKQKIAGSRLVLIIHLNIPNDTRTSALKQTIPSRHLYYSK